LSLISSLQTFGVKDWTIRLQTSMSEYS